MRHQATALDSEVGAAPLITASISGNQLCAGRTTGVRRCYALEGGGLRESSVRFFFREAEMNGTTLDALHVYRYGAIWSRLAGSHRSGSEHQSEGLFVEVDDLDTFFRAALDELNAQRTVIYLPAVVND
jgi:hypothetical protein